MTGMHHALLKRKLFRDMTGNNVNHPNDFLARVYAQTILAVLEAERDAARNKALRGRRT